MIDTFWRDLKRGKQVERMALDLIHTKYPNAHIIHGYNKFWDIYVPDDNKLLPVNFIGNGDTKQKTAYLIKKNILYKYKER